MKKIFVRIQRFLRFFRNQKVAFKRKEESIGVPGIFHVSCLSDRLFPGERRQLCISLRKHGYGGDCAVDSMKKFLFEKALTPVFYEHIVTNRLVCVLEFTPYQENMASAV